MEPLATAFLLQRDQKGDALTAARAYVDPDKGVETPEDALAGARDIVAELAAEDPTLRQTLREQLWNHGFLQTELVEEAEEAQTFLMYADYREPVRTLPSHRTISRIIEYYKTGKGMNIAQYGPASFCFDILKKK